MESRSDNVNVYIRAIQKVLAGLSDEEYRVYYDAVSDSLYIDFDEKAPYTVNDYLFRGWMVRVDPRTGEVHGLHIENALAGEIDKFPWLFDMVLLADPEGFTPSPVEQALRKRIAGDPSLPMKKLRQAIDEFAGPRAA